MAKKKKKEEFDASLMGSYLPGAVPVIVTIPVNPLTQITQRMPDFLQHRFRYGSGDYDRPDADLPEPRTNWHSVGAAWAMYAFGAGPSQAVIQTPQAYGLSRPSAFQVYPTFRAGLAVEFVYATIVLATLYTILDPNRYWRQPFTEQVDPQFIDPQFIPEGMTHGGYI
jgi:hypothetical protein